MKEIFKDVPNYEGYYQVSNLGRVKSLPRVVNRKGNSTSITKQRYLKTILESNGYNGVSLSKKGVVKKYLIHQLVAMAFLDYIKNGFNLVVDHIDNNKLNNKLNNLQIVSQRKNTSKDRENGLSKYLGVTKNSKGHTWNARLHFQGVRLYLGSFKTEYEAHLAYQKKLKEIEYLI